MTTVRKPIVGSDGKIVDADLPDRLLDADPAVTYATGDVHFIVSDTAPAEAMLNGRPVVWINPAIALMPVPVIPQEPMWSDTATTVTIPSGLVGIQYRNAASGAVLPQGNVAPGIRGADFTVEAVALPGYVLPTTFSWKHKFLDPAKATLIASDTFTGTQSPTIVGRTLNNALGGTTSLLWRGLKYSSSPFWAPPSLNWVGGGYTGHGLSGSGTLKYTAVGAAINPALTTSTSGGTLAAATYRYMVTAVLAVGETGVLNEKTIATTGATSSNTLTWTMVAGATNIRIWRSTTSGQEKLLATLVGSATSYVDDGSASLGSTTPPYQGDSLQGFVGVLLGQQWQRATFDTSGVSTVSDSLSVRFRAPSYSIYFSGYAVTIKHNKVDFAVGNDLAGQSVGTVVSYSFSHTANGAWDVYAIGDTITAVAPNGTVYTTTLKPYMVSTSSADRTPGNGIIFQPGGAGALANLKIYEVGV